MWIPRSRKILYLLDQLADRVQRHQGRYLSTDRVQGAQGPDPYQLIEFRVQGRQGPDAIPWGGSHVGDGDVGDGVGDGVEW